MGEYVGVTVGLNVRDGTGVTGEVHVTVDDGEDDGDGVVVCDDVGDDVQDGEQEKPRKHRLRVHRHNYPLQRSGDAATGQRRRENKQCFPDHT